MYIDYENRILNCAAELFSTWGIVSVTMDDIAHKVGASKKTIYDSFHSKEEMLTIIINKFIEEQRRRYADINNSVNAIEELLMLFKHFQDLFDCLHPKIVFEIQKYYPEIWAKLQSHKNNELLEKIKSNLERGIREGLYQPDIDINFIAKLKLNELEFAYNPSQFPHEKYTTWKITEQLLKIFLFGTATSVAHKKFLLKISTDLQFGASAAD